MHLVLFFLSSLLLAQVRYYFVCGRRRYVWLPWCSVWPMNTNKLNKKTREKRNRIASKQASERLRKTRTHVYSFLNNVFYRRSPQTNPHLCSWYAWYVKFRVITHRGNCTKLIYRTVPLVATAVDCVTLYHLDAPAFIFAENEILCISVVQFMQSFKSILRMDFAWTWSLEFKI